MGPFLQTLVNIGGLQLREYDLAYHALTGRSQEVAPDGTSFVAHMLVGLRHQQIVSRWRIGTPLTILQSTTHLAAVRPQRKLAALVRRRCGRSSPPTSNRLQLQHDCTVEAAMRQDPTLASRACRWCTGRSWRPSWQRSAATRRRRRPLSGWITSWTPCQRGTYTWVSSCTERMHHRQLYSLTAV